MKKERIAYTYKVPIHRKLCRSSELLTTLSQPLRDIQGRASKLTPGSRIAELAKEEVGRPKPGLEQKW